MSKFVKPKTFLVGYSNINWNGLYEYLEYTDNNDFLDSVSQARKDGISEGEILCSMYAKLCYKSLTLGKNSNVTRIRDIPDNLAACFSGGHASPMGHCNLNFVTTDCSRVFTHELVRNHVGTEFSQTSGRYVRGDSVDLILDPILSPVEMDIKNLLDDIENNYKLLCDRMGLNGEKGLNEVGFINDSALKEEMKKLGMNEDGSMDFTRKKKVTSALRRILPNGQSNEIGWSINLRALRHVIQVRTSRHAEWEIRYVFNEVYNIVKDKFPLILAGAKCTEIDGLLEISGLKTQPYQLSETEVLDSVTVTQLSDALARRDIKETV